MLEYNFEVVQTTPVVAAGREHLSEKARKSQCTKVLC